jgi:hypothetical protein
MKLAERQGEFVGHEHFAPQQNVSFLGRAASHFNSNLALKLSDLEAC